MAQHHYNPTTKKPTSTISLSLTSFLFISLLCSISLLLAFSLFKSSIISPPSQNLQFQLNPTTSEHCDFTDGNWVYDTTIEIGSSTRYDHTCKEIFKGWNCYLNNKSNALEISKWKWKPRNCDLPNFDARRFLHRFRDTSIGFIGDSLNRNMFVSLYCMLRQVSTDVKKWHPAKADRGFTFLQYNLTIAYHRTNLLARYGRWSPSDNGGVLESLGYNDGYRVDIDVPDSKWAEAPSFHDVVIYNTGHWWWAPSKFDPVKSPMLFFEKGKPIMPPIAPDVGLDLVLKHMILYVESKMRPGTIRIFRTQSPRHFEGGDWDHGGSCPRVKPMLSQEVEELFAVENNGTNVETRLVNHHLYKALKGSSFYVLNITHMSEYRADAHPSNAGGKKHDDCMHWCLPGITDTWNDLFAAYLNNVKDQS
ncbi:protein trichome birefringence-like 13 isoform X1 [Beta vulgaris subsp. vulgaris]|uniref:protein trichome birefringence-like 13 isoform X1 n=1 Tax=Beta vulgaris subsp. vulgaris TaxID=3555 RepID=UPI002037223F|nr:protein trichome birefringence-like 13 isoform X1 [Beta vulgaris subsp. vulgaris]